MEDLLMEEVRSLTRAMTSMSETNIELSNIIVSQIEFLSMLIVQYGDILGEGLVVQIDHQIRELKYKNNGEIVE